MSYHSTFAGWRDFELDVAGLAIGRAGRVLAEGLSFVLRGGQAMAVTGPNGAGKSTLLRALAGLLPAMAGAARVRGAGVEAGDPAGLHAHYIGHADGMKSALSVRENLDFWASMLGARGGLDAARALAAVGLAHALDFPAGYLSAGQKRRIALARLLVAPRPLWLLDEPTTALDVAAQAQFADAMRGHLACGGLILAATHAPLGLEGLAELRLQRPVRGLREPGQAA